MLLFTITYVEYLIVYPYLLPRRRAKKGAMYLRYGMTAEFEVRKEVKVKRQARFSPHMHLLHTCTHT